MLPDDGVIGAPFYVMREVDGVVLRTGEDLDRLHPTPAHALGFDLIDVLARLHRVDPDAVGLGDFGRPDGYLERQVRRWESSGTRPTRARLLAWSSWVTGSGGPCPRHRRRRSCMVTTAWTT